MRCYKNYMVKFFAVLSFFLALSGTATAVDRDEEDFQLKRLGKFIFFDKISRPANVMSCASCHDPGTGFTGPDSDVNLHQVAINGANPHTVGNLKPPGNAYASFIGVFEECNRGGARPRYCGGNFWDGRAEGRGADIGGAIFPAGATKHIGEEVFQGISDEKVLQYAKYFGPISDQALNPMPNPVEQNIDRQSVCRHVKRSVYAKVYKRAWGVRIDCRDVPVEISASDVETQEKAFDISFKRMMLAVGAWQHSSELNSFSSKRDIALRAELACLEGALDADFNVCAHPDYINSPGKFPLVGLTEQENLGHDLFFNAGFGSTPFPDLPATQCALCHSDTSGSDGAEPFQLYTNSSYNNIGTPANPELPADAAPGLAAHTALHEPGFVKTPTLRNVDKRKGDDFIKAYTHNGWFKSLESLVHFYNTAAIAGATAESYGITRCAEEIKTEREALANNCWPEPEWPDTAASSRIIGDIGMTLEQEAALVAYLKTLSDTVTPEAPKKLRAKQHGKHAKHKKPKKDRKR